MPSLPPLRTLAKRLTAVTIFAALSCTDATSPRNQLAPEASPQLSISDQRHEGGRTGFNFLPPLVRNSPKVASFDATVAATARICSPATTCTTVVDSFAVGASGAAAITVNSSSQKYQAAWHSPNTLTLGADNYRLEVWAGGVKLGHVDLYIVSSSGQLGSVPSGYVGLVRGNTLDIKFRIATGTVGAIDVTPDSATILVGGTQGFVATVRDLHGNVIASPPPIAWSSANTAVATVSPPTGASTTATGVGGGTTQIIATSGGGSGSATLTVNAQIAPVAQADSYGVNAAGTSFTVPAPGLLANDNLGTPAATLVSFGGGSLGGSVTDHAAGSTVAAGPGNTLTVNADGSLTFVHGASFTSDITFSYRITNGAGSSDATVTLVVERAPDAVNDGPAASSAPGQAYHTGFNTPITIPGGASPSILANDDLGAPAASVVSFGGGSFGGSVADNAAGASASSAAGNITIASDGTLTYTPTTGFTGLMTVDYKIQNTFGSDVATITIAVGNRPDAVNDTYAPALYGNVPVNTAQSTQFSVLANDPGSALTATVVPASAVGGTVSLDPATGKFTFTPDVGTSGAASFQYTTSNGFGTSAPATVSLTVGAASAWFVDGAVGATGDGRYDTPFKTLAELAAINDGGALHAESGDLLFVYENGVAYSGPLTLLASQKLVGQDATTSLASIAGAAYPADSPQPVMNSGNATRATIDAGVTLGASNTLTGFTLGTAAGSALSGTGFGTLTVSDVSISTTGQAISLTNGSITGAFDAVSSSGGLHNIALSAVSGAASADFGSGALSGATDDGVSISGGSGALQYAGTIANNVAGKYAVNVANRTGGSVTLTGSINGAGAGSGVAVRNNTGGAVTLSGAAILVDGGTNHGVEFSGNGATASLAINAGAGGLVVSTTSGNAIEASGAGSLVVTGSANALTSTGGVALRAANVSIGAAGLTFKSISANGGTNGISLVSTGTIGGLTVTGDGVTAGSGGSIQNMLGADGAVSGNGVYLDGAAKIGLNLMSIHDHQGNGLYAANVRDIALSGVRFTGLNGTSNSVAFEESAVHLVNVSGGVSVKGSVLDGGAFNAAVVRSTSGAPVLDSLVFAFDTVNVMQGSLGDPRSSAVVAGIASGSADIRMRDNHVTYWWANAIHVLASSAGSATALIQNNHARQTSGALAGAAGIVVSGGNLAYNISFNDVQGTNGTAIVADKTPGGANLNGTIAGNTIGTSGVVNSGSATGIAIFASHTGTNSTTVKISNNVIRQINGSGNGAITVIAGDDVGGGGSGTMNATVTGNNIQESGSSVINAQAGILVTHGRASGDTDIGCYDIGGAGALANSITNFNTAAGGTNVNRIRINERFLTTARFPGYLGATNDNAALGAYLLGRNTASNALIANNVAAGGGGFTNTPGGAACPQPTM